ncbi:MAG: hypothetical protein OEZ48_13365, partial [Candidatus Bathyarchaeota archaeon]|nr:hypothetical protein [Candidatus Bathyarchaeota archaeon]
MRAMKISADLPDFSHQIPRIIYVDLSELLLSHSLDWLRLKSKVYVPHSLFEFLKGMLPKVYDHHPSSVSATSPKLLNTVSTPEPLENSQEKFVS